MIKRTRNPEDTGKTVAIVTLIGAAGYGIYKWIVRPSQPLNGWSQLDQVTIYVSVSTTAGWIELDIFTLPVSIPATAGWVELGLITIPVSLVIIDWIELDSVLVELSWVIDFSMTIWGIPPDFGDYDSWTCYYYDLRLADFVGDEKWYASYSEISFDNIKTGGWVAVFLLKGTIISNQYSSPTFDAVNKGIYQYDTQLNRISKIG